MSNFHKKIFSAAILIAIVLTIPIILFETHHPQDIRQHAASLQCNSTGVTKNANGTYTFAKLAIDSQGNIVDANNSFCIIHLLGINMGPLFLQDAGGTTNLTGLEGYMQFFSQSLHSNVIRVNYNSYWWDTDVRVPKAQMNFKQWLQTYVKLEKQAGHYVILDAGTQFHNPPCGYDPTTNPPTNVTLCPSQGQANKNIPPDPTELTFYQPTALQAISELSQLYANDPAVIFDVWNEPTGNVTESVFMQDMTDRINTVRQYTPSMVVMVYERAIRDIMSGQFQDFTQPNILFDSHTYGANWTRTTDLAFSQYIHSHGHALIEGEWGASTGTPPISEMIPFLQTNDVESTYFTAGDLITGNTQSPGTLNSLGQAVAVGYQSIFGSLPPSPTFSITPTPTTHPSPTTSVTPSPTPAHSPTPTNIPTPTSTPSITPTPDPNNTILSLTVCPHGLGNCGDNANPTGKGTQNPKHPTRTVTITVFDLNNNPVGTPTQGSVTYVPSAGNFQGTVDIGSLPTGNYQMSIQTDGHLIKRFPGIVAVTSSQTNTLPAVSLVNGDINNDNKLDILDYNILANCFGAKQNTSSCTNPPTLQSAGADIDDTGIVDGADYNLLIREMSVQQGQ